ncbi:MAG: retention module-containing protein, partial [Aeromonadaceae bacterium]
MGQMIEVHDEKIISSVTGEVHLVVEGRTWVDLQAGDKVPAGSILLTSAGADVIFEATDPALVRHGSDITVQLRTAELDRKVLPHAESLPDLGSPPASVAAHSIAFTADPNIAALQQKILDGQDLDALLEANGPAAGGTPAAGGDGTSSNAGFITVERTAKSTLANAGFDTSYQAVTPLVVDERELVNRKPVITALDDSGLVIEDRIFLTEGQLSIVDEDEGESFFIAQRVTTEYGQFTVDVNGKWRFELDNSSPIVQSLNEGQSVEKSFEVKSQDGSASHVVTVEIQGTNDLAQITGSDSGLVKEDEILSVTGQLTILDPDQGQAHTLPQTVSGQHGQFSIDKDGNWSYQLNNSDPAVQALLEGERLPNEVFTVQSVDGASHQVTITIVGTTDGSPDIIIPDQDGGANASDWSLSEDLGPMMGSFIIKAPDGFKSLEFDGKLLAADDVAALLTRQVSITTAKGVLTLLDYDPASGTVSYSYDPNVLVHTNGQPIIDSFTLKVTDKAGGTVTDTLDIAITDTVPVAKPDSNTVVEDGPASTTGNVLGNDNASADAGSKVTTIGKFVGQYGELTLNEDGSYRYTLNNAHPAVNALKTGQSLNERFDYSMVDGDGSSSSSQLEIIVQG